MESDVSQALLNGRRGLSNKVALVAFAFAAYPSIGHANAIIPYLWVPIGQLFLFPLVVAAESWLVWLSLKGGFRRILWRVLLANLASTAVGAALYFLSMPLVGKPLWDIWNKFDTPAAIIISFLIAAVLFGVSWLVETKVMVHMLHEVEKKRVRSAMLSANLVTYLVLWSLSVLDA